jgi:hypothetical protein
MVEERRLSAMASSRDGPPDAAGVRGDVFYSAYVCGVYV